ncbi:MAG: phosphoribosylaminoimidazolesuccinocarboxamide synthase, partial [Deltaproteobacteria bacterium]|nr:phosphoribosylaminoimidazolesuccinocarboxamide synthase [Deltaproteobacteria bacterium]
MSLFKTDFPGLNLLHRGKVRDIYKVGRHLLIVATDRLSAFDVVLPTPIPGKGCILTQMSLFWF